MRSEKRVPVRVKPRSKEDRILGYDDAGEVLLINVKAAPVNNAANDAVIKLLSKTLKIPQRRIRIARGTKLRDKSVVLQIDQTEWATIKSL